VARLGATFERIAAGEVELGFDPLARDERHLTQFIPVELIDPDPDQPRVDLGDVSDMAASMKVHGVLEAIIVSSMEQGRFQVIAGHRRFAAAQVAGLRDVPATVRQVDSRERLELQLIENLHRKDLNPVEEALGYRRLMAEFGYSQGQLGDLFGRSRPGINQILRVLGLPAPILEQAQRSAQATHSVLLEIAKQPTEEAQFELWEHAQRGELTVKRAREKKSEGRPAPKPKATQVVYDLEDTVVTVRFKETETPSPAKTRAALEEALSRCRASEDPPNA
jgi:ParB family chromosome partitioning protein